MFCDSILLISKHKIFYDNELHSWYYYLFRSTKGIDATRSFDAFENRTFALFATIWFARLNIIITKEDCLLGT